MSFSIRLSDNEKKLVESYAKLHSVSVGEAFKKALFDKIEDEYDVACAEIAYREYLKDPVTMSLDELRKELDI